MAKGDKITVLSRIGESTVTSETMARQNGRTVYGEIEKEMGTAWYVVTEKTRGSTIVRKDRYALDSIIFIREEFGE